MLNLRDFIYMDIEKLKSIIAQTEKGVIDSIIETKGQVEKVTGDTKGNLLFLSSKISGESASQNNSSSTKYLHDYLYNKVEESLFNEKMLIRIPHDINVQKLKERTFDGELSDTSFVLLRGKVIINDYKKLMLQLNHTNEFIKSFQASSEIQKLKEKAETEGHKVSKKKLKEITDNIEKNGRFLEDSLIKGLNITNELFFRDRTIIKIVPYEEYPEFRFTGILDSNNLRDNIDNIIYKYGTAPVTEWNIFAQIASIPPKIEHEPIRFTTGNSVEIAFNDTFDVLRSISAISSQSATYPEISITPIAIYRG
ncbi:DUF6414 family protein [Methanocella sp. MCL-LM]|uniref:DUF6414 family protein n=1 Tax=Methanocella sp. MCL-LM TaxID=3412035 RepID=UPI003C755C9D